jgi:hypothetical protein
MAYPAPAVSAKIHVSNIDNSNTRSMWSSESCFIRRRKRDEYRVSFSQSRLAATRRGAIFLSGRKESLPFGSRLNEGDERKCIQRPAGRRAALESQGPSRPAGPLQCMVRRR